MAVRTRRRSRLVLPLGPLLVFAGCTPKPEAPRDETEEPSREVAIGRTLPAAGVTLEFPPPVDGRKARPELNIIGSDTDLAGGSGFAVMRPKLEDDGTFEVMGQTVRVVFNRDAKLTRPVKDGKTVAAAAGTLEISPAVAGKAEWTSNNVLEFTAKQPFDPEQEYTVTVTGVTSDDDSVLGSPWTAKFTATPRIEIAGKVITYLPQPGEPRIVAVFPHSGSKISANAKVSVVFDQPVTTDQAKQAIEVWTDKVPDYEETADADEQEIPVKLAQGRSNRVEGYTVNPRQVIDVRGTKPFAPGSNIAIKLDNDEVFRYRIAGELKLKSVGCGYSYDRSLCDWSEPTLRTDGREVVLEYTNQLDRSDKQLRSDLIIVPAVANMNVWSSSSWDGAGRVILSGAFTPSTSYTVFLPALKDIYGGTVESLHMNIETAPLAASVSMPEGVLILDEAATRSFTITSQNVATAEISAWEVEGTAEALARARNQVENHERPTSAASVKIRVQPDARVNEFVKTSVDLLGHLTPGKNYILTLDLDTTAFAAEPVKYPSWMSASRQPLALVTPGDSQALAVHSHVTAEATLVHVARLGDGAPVVGATFSLDGQVLAGRTTDARGFAMLPIGTGQAETGLLEVKDGATVLQVPLRASGRDTRLFPNLTASSAPLLGDRRGMVITDRGIYRPGAVVKYKAMLRRKLGESIVPLEQTPVRVRVLGPTDDLLADVALVTDAMGSVHGEYQIPAESRVGRHRLEFVEAAELTRVLDDTIVQVAEFEPPRFTVDVSAELVASNELRSLVLGKYLFGAAMDNANVEWTLQRQAAPLPSGPFTDAGFRFTATSSSWWDEEDGDANSGGWSRSGSANLGPDGTVAVTQKLDLGGAVGPQRFMFEADVADTSYRHIAGRASVIVHPSQRYAGLKLDRPWGDVGTPMPVKLGVIDRDGKPVTDVTVTARLKLIDWTYVRKAGKGGQPGQVQWQRTVKDVDSCTAQSASVPAECNLTPPENGSYEIVTEIDGKAGGSTSVWAWGRSSLARKPVPSRGRTVEIVADKSRYAPGETARLMVQNPYPAATVLWTIEQGSLLSHQVMRLDEAATVFELPIVAGYAPYVHATVTLLPIDGGESRSDWKIGALRVPVAMTDVRLAANVRSDRDTYEPGEQVTITVDVTDKGQPVAGADIALAVVDEGILRMTNFQARDPASALRPGQPLHFQVVDTRDRLAALLEHSQTAGDGEGDGSATISNARKNFVQTAFWKPDLRTDSAGRASVSFTLPDNLTRFRMMAVVADKQGKGVAAEHEFTVRRPVMMVPIVPRFAAVGDRFDAATMVHNNTDQPFAATVALGSQEQVVVVPPQGHERVNFPQAPTTPGELSLDFSVKDADARVRDAVLAKIPVDIAGLPERPALTGAFVGSQTIQLKVPASVAAGRGDAEVVTVQVGQHLWPELGARMQFLLDYPHGCVEQTTSGLLPLLAAKDILPRIGFTGMTQADLDKRIDAGLKRLASMRTSRGGLGYWPGDNWPNVYGTAYAARAVIAAKRANLELPAGLLESVESYLQERLLSDGVEAEIQASIAQALAELGTLPASSADALFDRKSDQGIFGKASLALALNALPGQDDRVKGILDEIEAGFDSDAKLVSKSRGDHYYYGSSTRTRAQVAIALGRLRPGKLHTQLVQDLAGSTDAYTTQATAFSLMAVAEQLRSAPAEGSAFTVELDGTTLSPARELGGGSHEFHVPLADLRGRERSLVLRSDSPSALAFIVRGAWKRDLQDSQGLVATTANKGPSIYRVITDARGGAVDLAAIKPGQMLRVALLADLPVGDLESSEMNYLAVTDRLPAGFEPIQPDLWTVAKAPEVVDTHPFYDALRWGGSDASFVELRDDRVHVYFDRVWGERVVATYMVRASTPGQFVLPPAAAEFMYVGNSHGYSTSGTVTVK